MKKFFKLSNLLLEQKNSEIIPTRTLGKTGANIPILGLGGAGVLDNEKSKERADELLSYAVENGIKYFDTAYSYGKNGSSEKALGRILPSVRDKVYINTKTRQRSYDGAMREFEASLKRLKTDYVECLQLHDLNTIEELDQISDGAYKALSKLKSSGACKFIGATGHSNPYILLEACKRFDLDTILCVVNCADIHFLSFIDNLLPYLKEKNIGVIAMKILAAKRLARVVSPKDCIHYSLSIPGVNCGIIAAESKKQLKENIDAAKSFSKMSKKKKKELENKTKDKWKSLSFYKEGFKWPKNL